MLRYIICARKLRGGEFISEPGPPKFLKVPDGELPGPQHHIKPGDWVKEVQQEAADKADPRVSKAGDVLIFVHGYNNSIPIIDKRHSVLQEDLDREGWRGIVLSFDWPSASSTLNYLEDRSDAAATARYLVSHGVVLLVNGQEKGCETNIHLLGHSTGAYVIMQAFTNADAHGELFKSDWRVGQVAFIGGDVSADSLDADSQWSNPMYRRIMRLTNYQNGYDNVLAISNAKRLGVKPRAGRVGLTPLADRKAVNVDCSEFFVTIDPKNQANRIGSWNHSWHIGNPVFARDLAMTLEGRIDRNCIPTRRMTAGRLYLQDGQRPPYEDSWLDAMAHA